MRETGLELTKEAREGRRDPFRVAVAGLAVFATVIGAWVGLLLADASNSFEEASTEAQRKALLSARAATRANQEIAAALRRAEIAVEHRARARNALQSRLLGDGDAAELQARERRSRRLAQRADTSLRELAERSAWVSDISAEGRDGLERDPWFPVRVRSRAQREALEQQALRDGANEEASEWGKRGASYAAILTILAVAIYLLGFAATDQGRPLRGLFAFAGVSFLALGIAFGPIRSLSPPSRPAPEAARAYAEAAVLRDTGTTKREYRAALDEASAAIRARPTFSQAYQLRTSIRTLVSTPQVSAFVSLQPPAERRKNVNDRRLAYHLGQRTPRLLWSLGFDLIAVGIAADDDELLEEGEELTRQAIDGDPRNAATQFNLAIALLAQGEIDAARTQFRRATRFARRAGQEDAAEGTLTDLELLSRYGDVGLEAEILARKEAIVRGIYSHEYVPRADVRIANLAAFAEPGYVEFEITDTRGLEEDDALIAQWYQRAPSGLGWAEIDVLSGPVFLEDRGDGTLGGIIDFASFQRTCLPRGRYRLELYARSGLVATAETGFEGRFQPLIDHESGLAGCLPPGWVETTTALGAGRLFVPEDETGDAPERGLYLVRVDRRATPDQVEGNPARRAAIAHALRWIERELGSQPRAVGGEEFAFAYGGRTYDYRYDGGTAIVGASVANDGSTAVAVAFAPREQLERERSLQVRLIASLGEMFDTAERPEPDTDGT